MVAALLLVTGSPDPVHAQPQPQRVPFADYLHSPWVDSVFNSLSPDERIAQLIIAPVVRASIEERRHAGETTRGAGGFGSTGSA